MQVYISLFELCSKMTNEQDFPFIVSPWTRATKGVTDQGTGSVSMVRWKCRTRKLREAGLNL